MRISQVSVGIGRVKRRTLAVGLGDCEALGCLKRRRYKVVYRQPTRDAPGLGHKDASDGDLTPII